MSRFLSMLLTCSLCAGVAACSKPSPEDCRKAILNLQRIRGLDNSTNPPDPEAFTRKCRATGDPVVVRCLIEAKNETDVARCEPPPAK